MKRLKLALNYRGLDVNGILLFALRVKNSMNGNPHFSDAAYLVTNLGLAIDKLEDAIYAPEQNKTVMKSRQVKVEKILYALKAIVELECNDNEAIAVGSGFELKADTSYKASIFRVKQGSLSGTVELSYPSSSQRTGYIWEMLSDPMNEHEWSIAGFSVLSSFHITSLVPGNKYWFRVRPVTSEGPMAYSNPLMLHVI